MSRRALTLLLAAALAVVLGLGAFLAPVPYVALGPGPTFNTLGAEGGTPVIEISGRQTYPDDGHLDLTTVGVRPQLTLAEALRGWFDRSEAVVPREIVIPPGQTDQQVDQTNRAEMQQSQSSATTAALTELGIPASVVVTQVASGSPADGKLQVGDVITAVDGIAVTSSAQLRTLIAARAPGDQVRIGYTRSGNANQVTFATGRAAQDTSRPVIGVTPGNRFPVMVTIHLQDVGGPSAGLAFALGIIDKLSPGSLTGGRYIAGTGTISDSGDVGPIGGIGQKMAAARAKGATVFLTPADNCAEALANQPKGLRLIRVATLEDALAGLRTLTAGGTPRGCAG